MATFSRKQIQKRPPVLQLPIEIYGDHTSRGKEAGTQETGIGSLRGASGNISAHPSWPTENNRPKDLPSPLKLTLVYHNH